MSHLGARIRRVLEEKNITQSELARLVGVKQQTISYICSPESPAATSRYSVKISQILGVNPLWLQSGEGDRLDPMVKIDLGGIDVTVTRLALLAPQDVIPHINAGGKSELKEALMTDIKIGEGAFAIELQGESMMPLFKEHDKVVIDLCLMPQPGDYVAVSVDGVVAFRKYRQTTSSSFELVPNNSDWPIIRSTDGDVKVIGVMVEHRSYRTPK